MTAEVKGKTEKEFQRDLKNGIRMSLSNMHPLSGLNKNEAKLFIESLTEDERKTLAKAIKFYNDTLIGNMEISVDDLLKDMK